MPVIRGGYYIKARKIQNSEIATAAPHVREIWDWLIKEVNHKDTRKFKRGQTMRSLSDISEGLKWFAGYRKMTYSKSSCENALRWLRKHGMIETAKTTRGMIITVINYDTYQNPANYESNSDSSTKATRKQQSRPTINKNVKNVKNGEGINTLPFSQITLEQFTQELIKKDDWFKTFDMRYYYRKIRGHVLGKKNKVQIHDWVEYCLSWITEDYANEKKIFNPNGNLKILNSSA